VLDCPTVSVFERVGEGTFSGGSPISYSQYKYADSTVVNDNFYACIPVMNVNPDETIVEGDIYTYGASGYHSHNFPHTHSFPHWHYIDLKLITAIETGIKLFEMASDVSVKVNGQTVIQNINNDTTLDIIAYIKLNTDNKIEIFSNTNGRIDFTTKCKYFCQF
jgi:hypothetical protein